MDCKFAEAAPEWVVDGSDCSSRLVPPAPGFPEKDGLDAADGGENRASERKGCAAEDDRTRSSPCRI